MLLVLYLYSGIHFLLLAMRGSRNFFRWVGGGPRYNFVFRWWGGVRGLFLRMLLCELKKNEFTRPPRPPPPPL